jgi:hypothetical protein
LAQALGLELLPLLYELLVPLLSSLDVLRGGACRRISHGSVREHQQGLTVRGQPAGVFIQHTHHGMNIWEELQQQQQ